jgi:hypothetical protein
MGQIIATITKSVLLAVVSSAATILINEYWSEKTVTRIEPQFEGAEGPGFRF